jgi:integration host factor subunit beta
MTRAELVTKISMRMDVSKKEAELYLSSFLESIVSSLHRGERVVIQGFGSFSMRTYSAREAKKPLTGEILLLPERSKPVFQPGRELRERVNQEICDKKKSALPRRRLRISVQNILETASI